MGHPEGKQLPSGTSRWQKSPRPAMSLPSPRCSWCGTSMRCGSSKLSEQRCPTSGERDGGPLFDHLHRGGEDYIAGVSRCLSSATAAWIAALIVAIRAIFAAGLRSRAAPISPANMFSAASMASAARLVAVFTAWWRSGSWARERSERISVAIDNPSPTEAVPRANLDRDCTIQRPSRRKNDLHTERNHPTANCPIGRASGSGGSHVHSRHAPARSAARCQARSRPAWAREGPPGPMPRRLGRQQTPRLTHAFLSPWENRNRQCSATGANKS